MGATLRYIGLGVLAGAMWFLLAGEVGWIGADLSDAWFKPLFGGGAALFALGTLLSLLDPLVRRFSRGRCVRCGVTIEKGQTYCLDHLKETVNESQDHIRDRVGHR